MLGIGAWLLVWKAMYFGGVYDTWAPGGFFLGCFIKSESKFLTDFQILFIKICLKRKTLNFKVKQFLTKFLNKFKTHIFQNKKIVAFVCPFLKNQSSFLKREGAKKKDLIFLFILKFLFFPIFFVVYSWSHLKIFQIRLFELLFEKGDQISPTRLWFEKSLFARAKPAREQSRQKRKIRSSRSSLNDRNSFHPSGSDYP